MKQENIRNFCIIAHIDHGKSTLADRLLERTHTISEQEMKNQVLDDMDLERERGITIKSHAIRMDYEYQQKKYILNLIDTPGHVDFSYEVSRSLAACEGALLVVDAAQGMEAQTLSNLYLAIDNNLEIIPVINKIDLPSADIEGTEQQIIDLIGGEREDIYKVSAKSGLGIEELLEAIIQKIPAPEGDPDAPAQAMIFDSQFDRYRGVIMYVRMVQGTFHKNEAIRFFSTGLVTDIGELGALRLKFQPTATLKAGEVGYMITGIKEVSQAKVGDTLISQKNPAKTALPGFQEVKPMVFSGIYPIDGGDYENLRDALEKLQLNDASLIFEAENSLALGFGFRCGFLGLLHMEIIKERLEREYDLSIISTIPSVEFYVFTKAGEKVVADGPTQLPPPADIDTIHEPVMTCQIIVPDDFVGNIMKLCLERRGIQQKMDYLDSKRVNLTYELPLIEILFDFYDKLKSLSRGYASFDYEYLEHRSSNMVQLDILINSEKVDAMSSIVHADKAYNWGREMADKLKEIIPRQMFDVAIQAAVGAKIIARSTVKALRKNVTAKCYGGDITRKKKLLERQKAGKKRMKQIGTVEVPQEAFIEVLKIDR